MKTKSNRVQLPVSTTVILYVSVISNFIVTFVIIKYFLLQ